MMPLIPAFAIGRKKAQDAEKSIDQSVAGQILEIQKRPSPHGTKMSQIIPEKILTPWPRFVTSFPPRLCQDESTL
jgi:hypothetical protein